MASALLPQEKRSWQQKHFQLPILISILILISVCCTSMAPSPAAAQTLIRVACGASSGNATDDQGREWMSDTINGAASSYLSLLTSSDVVATTNPNTNVPNTPPFTSARIFSAPAAYTFPVTTTGRHFLRLFFYPSLQTPSDNDPRNASDAVLSVMTDTYNLITNLSLSDLLGDMNLAYAFKEYSLNISRSTLKLTFLPAGTSSTKAFAMINGIELQSAPDDLLQSQAKDLVLNMSLTRPIQSHAFETMFRLNVGGQAIKESDDGIGRRWDPDILYMVGAATGTSNTVVHNISFGPYATTGVSSTLILDNLTAPAAVYTTARTMTNNNQVNLNSFLSWNLSVDPGFSYYIRLHFCEIQYSLPNQRVFNIYVSTELADLPFDIIDVTKAPYIATVKDYYISNTSVIEVQLQPTNATTPQYFNSILNGLEVFKVNSSSGSLQGPLPPPYVAAASNLEADTPSSSSSSKKVSIIAGVAGSLAALAALGLVFVCVRRRRSQKINSNTAHPSPSWLLLPTHSKSTQSKMSTGTSRKSGVGSYASTAPSNDCRYFGISEILQMTNNFDESWVIGVGGFGKVYKGLIDNGTTMTTTTDQANITTVAVKRSNPTSEQGVAEFNTEIDLLSKIRHRHLVSLIGFCEDHSEMILVYEYMGGGPLRSHLYGSSNPALSWKQRLEISIGSARGLHYLHTGAAQGIIHRDVKTTNILLDEDMVAKVSDFGLSKTGITIDQTHVSTAVKGSFGYLDPEYYRRQQLTEKSDVYSFGVVLLEVLCARPPINPNLPRDQVNLAEWAMFHNKKGMLDQIMDPYLKGRVGSESLKKFAETAEKCIAESGLDRPSMGDVLWNLEYALQLHEASPEYETDIASEGKAIENEYNEGMGAKAVSQSSNSALFSENSSQTSASALFSHIVNPQGR